ncbi:energy-coupling factor ABC transporter ATP-binding protein [Geobacter sp. AOG2]|uniref:energy-coupling factor ABC transporter ATP-binding protein n=1 Tax=Geobacter sp. AOG2 TaxID=1566347 RepID=UPI001CC40B04|nr:ATP-binding cassette domain-containing protein [Geobacter sp. AOG2]GFE61795.1 tungstate ABC transporter ATP-binding protein [Geobacter sp. AOG2]
MNSIYHINELKMAFGDRTVLDVHRLTIDDSRLHILTGANGAGKSTLLGLLAFLTPPTAGEVVFDNVPVPWGSPALFRLRRQATLMHQLPYLFAGSVQENVAYGLGVRGMGATEQRQRIAEALAQTGLTGFDRRNALKLSGGEIRRVAMARALALRPRVLLLDEPLANVDHETARLLEELITSLPQQGICVIMTTHEPNHAARLGGTTIHLVSGRVVQADGAAEGPVPEADCAPARRIAASAVTL